MGAEDLLDQAIEELYSVDPDEFMQRRTALAKQARSSDDKAAKDIAGLRKPTRSAYALNQLVRSDPEAAPRLAELGDALRAAQDALDGARMRELSTLRRGLIEELADQAFRVTGQPSPAPGLREEVVSTLNAAVADQGVVEQLGSGTLVRPARWDGFGFASPPELSVVRPSTPRQRAVPSTAAKPGSGRAAATRTTRAPQPAEAQTATKATRAGRASKPTEAQLRAAQAEARAQAKAEAKAEEQRRRQALAEAARAAKEADSALAKAVRTEAEQQTRVRHLHEQLTDARRRLDEIRIDLRRTENRQRKAQQTLDRRRQ
ncbi:MAG: hypothetical protein M3381_03875 [Actinomycetota bacterium]|nr:hypothetical protein [Actinomycetota bacterium]